MRADQRYTVKQLAGASGVTVRTLHYYDEIGLLRPDEVGENGYRYYGHNALLRLQQILFYRELDFALEQIKVILDRPDFDLRSALESHREALQRRIERLHTLIDTVDTTIIHLQGEYPMTINDYYSGFDEAKQAELAQQAEQKYGDSVRQSQQRWQGYTRDQKNSILADMNAISTNIAALMGTTSGDPASAEVQQWIDRWYRLINERFYDCSLEVFEQIGHGYTADPAFEATYEAIKPGLAAFMEQAMTAYVHSKRG